MRVSLCFLVWNELGGCTLDVPRAPMDQFDEVYAVDGGSTDGTVEYLSSLGIPVHRQKIRGYNGAMIEAFERCTTDAAVVYHPKGSIDPAETLLCKQQLLEGNDLSIASRIMKGGANEEDGRLLKPRKWFVVGLGLTTALLWKRDRRRGVRQPMAMDVLHGFRGMRRDKFFGIDPIREGLSMDLEMVARAYRKGYRVAEFPSREKPRAHGATHFKAWPTGKKLLKYLWREFRRPA
ncbi:MAG: glycosyltransferase [Phycisphaerae bacterium]|nr:glycosyltransferase [Phycisphaerae bacterium]